MTDIHISNEKAVASRIIEIHSFEGAEGRIVSEGTLIDERHIAFIGFSEDTIPAGRFHTFKAQVEIDSLTMRIEDIAVGFYDTPYHECGELVKPYRGLIGLNIESGFTRAVLQKTGGIKGCAHLTHLIITMGPALVQAAFTYRTRIESTSPPDRDQLKRYFLDSCHLWRADGPHALEQL